MDKFACEVGDLLVFTTMLTDDYRAWHLLSQEDYDLIKTLLGKTAKVKHIQKHYADKNHVEYFIDVEFPNGIVLKRVNVLCFEKIDFDWV